MNPVLAAEASLLAQTRVIDDATARGDSEIQQFYKDATVFITGGTGFMGKQMIEKLFRSCDVKKVFLLMRHKKNKSFYERLDQLLQDPVFDKVKKMKPDFVKKVCPIQGDITEVDLGISNEDWATIIEETEIIFHGAATVNFDEPLKVAVITNVRGTLEVLKLGKQCLKLKSYVHISTAYCNCTDSRIDQEVFEQFYDPPMSPEAAINMVSVTAEEELKRMTPKLIKNWSNTYLFTKTIAEEACRQASSDLPICIVRPAAVISSYQEPSPGWVDASCAHSAVSGFVLGVGLGVMHVLLVDVKHRPDIVPVDIVNNAVIAAGWSSANRERGKDEAKIYTITNVTRNDEFNTNDMLAILTKDGFIGSASPKSLYYSFVYPTKNRFMYKFLTWLWHYIPGYIIDLVLRAKGKKPSAVKKYSKIEKLAQIMSSFMTNKWWCQDKNLQELYNSLNPSDKIVYNFDVNSINCKHMTLLWYLGVRKHIIKDGLQGTEYGVKKQYWFKILHYSVVMPLYIFLLFKMGTTAFASFAHLLKYISAALKMVKVPPQCGKHSHIFTSIL